MNRPARILVVTLGLMAAGAVFGGLAAAVALAIGLLVTKGFASDFGLPVVAAIFGGALGSVAAPAVAWLFLRRVPLGRAVGVTWLGSVAGGVLGWTLPWRGDDIGSAVIGGSVGFLLSAVVLSVRHRALRRPEATARVGEGD